jgi:hypothetical protein
MSRSFPEKLIQDIWQNALQSRRNLLTVEKEPIEIVYPGRLNDDRGADFRDAVIGTARGLCKGDIEIHVRSSSWWQHRHHRDPTYNQVVLHVVFRDDAGRATVLENGFKVPTLALDTYYRAAEIQIPALAEPPPSLPCRHILYHNNPGKTGALLDAAGVERFQTKINHFREAAARDGASQALYAGIMVALGYSKNKLPMARLAGRMPLAKLEALIPAGTMESECPAPYQARLLGAAGLLPSQRGITRRTFYPEDNWENTLENTWSASGEKPAMRADEWRFFKVRPGNHPARRLAAMSCLLPRFRREGLLIGLRNIIQQAPADDAGRYLDSSLIVGADSFWGYYLDFGMPASGAVPALLGKERAAEIVVNVLLPFAAAGGFGVTPDLRLKAQEIYTVYRAPAENALVKHMRKQLGITRYTVDSARRQQGLIHLYKTFCSQGKCGECPLA